MSITLDHVRVCPPRSVESVVQSVSCTLRDGQVTVLTGTSGVGKSTLLRAASGVWPLAGGQVVYGDTPLWDKRRKRLLTKVQQQIGVVFQQPEEQLFARTVAEEFRYSLRPYRLTQEVAEARVKTALADLELPPDILPESPMFLSGGQKRRVALATTFATDPDWLFLDEPTAGLDPSGVSHLVHLLQVLRDRRSERGAGGIVIATHDLDELLPIADQVIVLHRGRVFFTGTPQALCEQPQVFTEAGIGLPARLALSLAFEAQGWPALPVLEDPERFAQLVVTNAVLGHARVTQGTAARGVASRSRDRNSPTADGQLTAHASVATLQSPALPSPQHDDIRPHRRFHSRWLHEYDPRAKWLFVLLASVSVLLQTTWIGVGVAALMTVGLAASVGLSAGKVLQVLKPLLIMATASGVVSGLRFGHRLPSIWHIGPVAYNFAAASVTTQQMTKVMVVVILGTLLSNTTSTLAMKRGIEQGLGPLRHLRLPVDAFALAASLMLRFIPLIFRETDRFAQIVRVRGKYPVRGGGLRLRDIPALIVPLLLSVLQLGESLALAIEARGYEHNRVRSRGQDAPMRGKEWGLISCGVVWLVVFMAARQWLGSH